MDKNGNTRPESRWRRKSFRRAETDTSVKLDKRKSVAAPAPTVATPTGDRRSEKGKERASTDGGDMPGPMSMMQSNYSASALSISIVPDRMQELPSWYNPELERTAVATQAFRKRYPLHNPIGPRQYRNHHLIPTQRRQGARPSSNFSPHFPPISASPGDSSLHAVSMPGPSRTPSGSPLPTPSSSQVRLTDTGLGGKPRTRKVSHGSPHDNVDLMDVSDPWGTNWHHQSPYDVGIRPEGDRTPGAVGSGDNAEVQWNKCYSELQTHTLDFTACSHSTC
jgi:hypothetical protein